ncbi:MAG: sugar phosphate isomerase/epimerase family protein [Marinosulfonomonas sp.]
MTYHLGLQGQGTPRHNPNGVGLDGFIELAKSIDAKALEIFDPWVAALSDDDVRKLRDKLDSAGIKPVVSTNLFNGDHDMAFRSADLLGADIMRMALTPVLCGDRAKQDDWQGLSASVGKGIRELGPRAADLGKTIGIENHQDFTSQELVDFCEMGPGVGITYDTGNSFPVAEAPLDFTKTVAPHVCLMHLKDYRAHFSDEGFRLVRCASGDGAVPFPEIFSILGQHHDALTAVIELPALEARHVKLFNPDWWDGYAPKSAQSLAACLLALQRNKLSETGDHRTPWERGADDELVAYELDMMRKSAENMKQLGIL